MIPIRSSLCAAQNHSLKENSGELVEAGLWVLRLGMMDSKRQKICRFRFHLMETTMVGVLDDLPLI